MFGASGSWEPGHWFDALAIAGAIDFDDAPALTLRWSVLETDIARAAKSGRVEISQFSTDNQRRFWSRLFQPIPRVSDNTVVNIVKMGDDIVTLTESPQQWVIDPQDLRTTASPVYDDELGGRALMLAHPIIENGTVTNLAMSFGLTSQISVYTHGVRERSRRVVGSWRTADPPYAHSFGLTDRTAIIVAHPFTLRPSSVLWSNGGFIEHFRWQPGRGARFVLVDRATGALLEAETDAFFTFHIVQAFETDDGGDDRGGTVTIDLLAYDDPSVIARLKTRALAVSVPPLDAYLTRFVIHRTTRRVERRRLSDVPFEFPYLDFELARGRSARTVYGASLVMDGDRATSEVVAIDTETGTARRFRDAAWTLCEPVFVGRPGRTREGDGVLLTVGSAEHASSLFVLDADTLEPLATARFDVPYPLSIHGSFVSAT